METMSISPQPEIFTSNRLASKFEKAGTDLRHAIEYALTTGGTTDKLPNLGYHSMVKIFERLPRTREAMTSAVAAVLRGATQREMNAEVTRKISEGLLVISEGPPTSSATDSLNQVTEVLEGTGVFGSEDIKQAKDFLLLQQNTGNGKTENPIPTSSDSTGADFDPLIPHDDFEPEEDPDDDKEDDNNTTDNAADTGEEAGFPNWFVDYLDEKDDNMPAQTPSDDVSSGDKGLGEDDEDQNQTLSDDNRGNIAEPSNIGDDDSGEKVFIIDSEWESGSVNPADTPVGQGKKFEEIKPPKAGITIANMAKNLTLALAIILVSWKIGYPVVKTVWENAIVEPSKAAGNIRDRTLHPERYVAFEDQYEEVFEGFQPPSSSESWQAKVKASGEVVKVLQEHMGTVQIRDEETGEMKEIVYFDQEDVEYTISQIGDWLASKSEFDPEEERYIPGPNDLPSPSQFAEVGSLLAFLQEDESRMEGFLYSIDDIQEREATGNFLRTFKKVANSYKITPDENGRLMVTLRKGKTHQKNQERFSNAQRELYKALRKKQEITITPTPEALNLEGRAKRIYIGDFVGPDKTVRRVYALVPVDEQGNSLFDPSSDLDTIRAAQSLTGNGGEVFLT